MLITQQQFNPNAADDGIKLITLESSNGIKAQVTNFGARLVSLFTPNRDGKLGNIIVGYQNMDDFRNPEHSYFGATVGRVANRIANGQFSIDGATYQVDINRGNLALHGGKSGWSDRIWTIEEQSPTRVVLGLHSPDGESGFPANVEAKAIYELEDDATLSITYMSTTDMPTPINITNHSYFNLSDEQAESVLNHRFQLNSDIYLEVDDDSIPTGNFVAVEGSSYDFRQIQQPSTEAKYDHHYVFNKAADIQAVAECPQSGRKMLMNTSKTGMQFYLTTALRGGYQGYYRPHSQLSAFCFETQFAPDSPNNGIDNIIFDAGDVYEHRTVFRFEVE